MKDRKFREFAPVDKQAWMDQAKKDLKGRDFEQRLVSMSVEGFPIYPYYAAEDTADTRWTKAYDNKLNPSTGLPGSSPRYWVNAVEVGGADEPAINTEMKFVLESGADGLILTLSQGMDFDKVFKDIRLPYISIWLKCSQEVTQGLKAFSDWFGKQGLDYSGLRGGILWDGLRVGFDQPIHIEEQIGEVDLIHHLFKPFPYFKSICLDTSVYSNAGGTAVQEIGYGSAALVELLDGLTEKGNTPAELFRDLFIYTAVGSDYFMEIAKLKTLRIAIHQMAELYQVNLPAEEVELFAATSRWSKSAGEPYNNLLRNTTEAMSAVLGGCNTLLVLPHDRFSGTSDVFSKRMARNISNILKEESYFDKVMDPAAGSYYIENLIHALYDQGVQLLKTVETEGGWRELYLSRQIQKEVKAKRKKKFDQLLRGEVQKVGIMERDPGNTFTRNPAEEDYQLHPYSCFSPYEDVL